MIFARSIKKRLKMIVGLCLTACFLLSAGAGAVAAEADGEESEGVGVFETKNIMKTDSKAGTNYRIQNTLITNDGTVWVFANDRRNSVADYTEIQWISATYSTDGENWVEPFYLLNNEGWQYVIGAPLYDAINDNIMLIYSCKIITDEAKAAHNALPESERQPTGSCIIESKDGGKTWKARGIEVPKLPENQNRVPYCHGCDTGFQIQNGEYAGRLVVTAHWDTGERSQLGVMSETTWVCILYSDDYGQTWKLSNNMPSGTSESSMCELPDGTLYINARSLYGDNQRYIGYSYDGGTTITNCKKESGVFQVDHNGIKASVTCFENPNKPGEYITLYASLLSPILTRRNLCVWISYDNGKTWPDIVTIRTGFSAYTSVRYNPVDELIYLSYEYGGAHPYSDGVAMARFDVDWLMANKRPYVPLRVNETPDSVVANLVTDGMVAHFTPESLVGLADGDSVTTWTDSTGNGNDAGVNRKNNTPVVALDAINGYPALSFDRKDESSLLIGDIEEIDGACTWFIVFKVSGSTIYSQNILRNQNPFGLSFYYDKGIAGYCTGIDVKEAFYIHSVTPTDRDYHIAAVVWDPTVGEGMLTQFIDGSTVDVKYCNGEPVETDRLVSTGGTVIGGNFKGEIAEIIMYNRALTDEEVAKNGLTLANTYDLTWEGVTPAEGSFTGTEPSTSDEISDTTDSVGDDSDSKGKFPIGLVVGGAAVLIAAMAAVAVVARKKRKNKND